MASYIGILRELRAHGNRRNVAGMARFGINPHKTLGVSMPVIRAIARRTGRDHSLAGRLWNSGVHEGRILATLIDDPAAVTPRQMDRWARAFDSWDVCDQCCSNLFRWTPFAYRKAITWSSARAEFVRRAGFVLMAGLAVADKEADDGPFERFLTIIERSADDPRNFVRKAVNWALRQIGKRDARLNRLAIRSARTIGRSSAWSARWIASDALRELTDRKLQRRLVTR